MKGRDFIPLLREDTFHTGRRNCDAFLDCMPKATHASPVPDSTDFKPERTVVPRLHDIRMSFRTGNKISLRYSNWGELAPV